MKEKSTYLNELKLNDSPSEIIGGFIKIDGEEYYQIKNYDQMDPFFISLVSRSDHWMFISTTGGLTAGRKNEESALFPYYTVDKITENAEFTGSKSIFRVVVDGRELLWEPFSMRHELIYRIERNLYKNSAGSKIIFEEVNYDLSLTFRYSWSFSKKYGFVKESKICNESSNDVKVEILDGLQNIMPFGVLSSLQSSASNLVRAYKKNELDENSGLGLYMLSAIIVDKAEPSEALKTTSVWSLGLEKENVLLSNRQLNRFRNGVPLTNEVDTRAERGAYLIKSSAFLRKGTNKSWVIVSEVDQDHADIIELIEQLKDSNSLLKKLNRDLKSGTEDLIQLVGKADGLQLTNDKLMVGRHYANVLFNIMRGGIFDEDYLVEKNDFLKYITTTNKQVEKSHKDFIDGLGDTFSYLDLLHQIKKLCDPDFTRICNEYLPLTFSRRHGDPSRPWNKFNIATKDENGNKLRYYEGNWRDIFQNWEALALSFPGYIRSMITKFVNASTIDGYNPYRITREGIDWEIIEPDDPWSYIGYWGDHQIIYLQKLLEVAIAHQEEELQKLLADSQFVYANVPYRIKGYAEIIKDPQDTINYDHAVEESIGKKVMEIGSDGKLVFRGEELLKANLTEKLLVSFLAKLSNYIPEGGIWLNTQRPEWNDANNALVGNGVSMVTLYYMRRFSLSMIELFNNSKSTYQINKEVIDLFNGIKKVFEDNEKLLGIPITNNNRKAIIDQLNQLGEQYRTKAYEGFKNNQAELTSDEIIQFFETTLKHIDHTIKANKRPDGLYHAYNLLSFREDEAMIDHLYEMLEGQVAVLSSGLLNLDEVLELLDSLKASKIYREDQYSYMLYPNRTLPRFLEKNLIPADFIRSSLLAQELLKDGDRSLIYSDVNGGYHFNGSFNNANSVSEALHKLEETKYKALVEQECDQFLDVFEKMFNHKAFTGRSGTFYGYEGLGSIYWHMVSKLLVAVQENIRNGKNSHSGTSTMGRMIDHYYEIRAGIGINKSPKLYGSFPTDPYSHTPGGRGAQQPGMTGQVKEDILNRWAELGVYVKHAKIHFNPTFLSKNEYVSEPQSFEYFVLSGEKKILELEKGQLAFTYCQVPIIYEVGNRHEIQITMKNDGTEVISGNILSKEYSKMIFDRTGTIDHIRVTQITE